MSFPAKVKEDALVASGRHCCLCHRFCGFKIEVHHIKLESEGGENSFDNSIALCFDCHADMRSYDAKHPKGVKYTENELRRHRDAWHRKVVDSVGLLATREVVATDQIVFKQCTQLLPWDGSIQFVRQRDFSGSFCTDCLNDFRLFLYKCENPAFEFIDADIEGQRVALKSNIEDFMEAIAIETCCTRNAGRNAIPAELAYHHPDDYKKSVDRLRDCARLVCDAYDSFVKLAIRKLGVLPVHGL